MIWEVFRQEEQGEYHTHCGNVHAPDREMAKQFAAIQHGRRKPTNNLWVVPKTEIGELDGDEYAFGGATDKSYRWATGYDVTADDASEVVESSGEQEDAKERRNEVV
ncbi:1,2-phenylacetyl-CoA epoxidase subunit PaaB [Natronobacterium gregoryi]|uniref:Enzyme of phenylacetate metabolism n=2 Tax=Natronobacterium gregoryi TaxID=44930 RepID=L0AGC3_NATGS|nr:1,2-phenylacetyl-CoA epoxidase subunit PaaB [Natronobacterium gregoryi]AFZ72469.1 putative enzyme of phenylacetate metabolism [Natronobacterium gregoryi SP2]ELY74339.1 phenylacetic acid degradation B [Natronobacterium gregoryi SP2]PLK21441.1 phenylacetic acid degradation protein PaaB [Natronobacterium gregoryi SP2]SFI77746.1 ring-1,2-phenylacetyl-CoA epoxidase subunit PaaB [Natronobacterium gregoryi]